MRLTANSFRRSARLQSLVAATFVSCAACGGPAASQAVAPSPTPAPDCRGATETASGAPSPSANVHFTNLTVDGRLRDYRLLRPPTLDYSKPVPLVLVFHGSPTDAAGMEDFIHFDPVAATAGYLTVSPNGCNGSWDYAEGRSGVADEDFIKKVIGQLKSQFAISKIFLVGASAGTWVEYRLACDLSGEVMAVASVAGTMRLSDSCQPAHPVSILEIHGTNDDQHRWDGGGPHGAFPVNDVIAKWTMLDGCTGTPTVVQQGITVTSTWNTCQGGAVVRLDKVLGGKHTWFGSGQDSVPGEPDANVLIPQFFGQF